MERLHLIKDRLFGDNLSMAFGYIKENFAKLKTVMIINIGLALIGGFLFTTFNDSIQRNGVGGILGFFFYLIVISLFQLYVTSYIASMGTQYVKGEGIEFKNVSGKALALMGWIILAGILNALAIGLGMIFFIIPGIYVAVAFSMYIYSMSYYDLGPIDGLSKSMDLISGHWWVTLGYSIIVGIFTAAITFIPYSITLGIATMTGITALTYLAGFVYILAMLFGSCLSGMFMTVYFFNLVDKYEGMYEDTRITSIGEDNREQQTPNY